MTTQTPEAPAFQQQPPNPAHKHRVKIKIREMQTGRTIAWHEFAGRYIACRSNGNGEVIVEIDQ